MAKDKFSISPGRALPLGVDDRAEGFNFAVFSRHAERIELLIFDSATSSEPSLTVDLSGRHHRTGDIWHALIEGARSGQAYAYRVHGPWAPAQGDRFEATALLLDPVAYAIAGAPFRRSVLVDRRFDWQGTCRPRTRWSDTVIYETHVRGLTIDPSANCGHPGTFLGVIDKIPYLRELGITAVELLPVQEFDDRMSISVAGSLRNYWGYNTTGFCAPYQGYATAVGPEGAVVAEFKTMVRALHRAGIEVILDVVFNHTAEGNEHGPLLNFRGFDNAIYYLLGDDKRTLPKFLRLRQHRELQSSGRARLHH